LVETENCSKPKLLVGEAESREVYLKIKTMAVAEKGKANKKILEILAKQLNIAKSRITIVKGEFSTKKILAVSGLNINNALATFIDGLKKV